MEHPDQINSAGKCLGKKRAIAPWATIFWALFFPMSLMVGIFLSSFIHTDGSTPGFGFIGLIRPDLQSGLHIPMFFALTMILLVLLQGIEKRTHNQILFAFVLSNYVGIMNEVLQMFIPGRHPSLGDVGLNLVGTVLGLVVYFGIKNWQLVRRRGEDVRDRGKEDGRGMR